MNSESVQQDKIENQTSFIQNDITIPLSFEDLWDKGEIVRKHSADRRKLFDEFTNLLNERSTVEAEYAKNIQRICTNMKRLISAKGDIGSMIQLYSNDLQFRYHQSISLSENIREYVVEYLKQILKEQDQQAKILFSESKKLEKDLQISLETLEKTRLRYLKTKRDLDDLQVQNQIYRVTSSTVPDKKDKHRLKVSQTDREVAEFKFVFQESLKNYNDYIESFYPDQWRIMQSFQKHDEERNERIHDGILKMLMFETSFFKNVEFQTQLLGEQIHKQDLSLDINKFVEQNRSFKPLYQQIQYEQFVSFVDCSMERIKDNSQPLQQKLDLQSELMIKKSIEEGQIVYESEENISNDKIRYVLDITIKAWFDQTIMPEQFNEFYHKSLEDIEYSKAFAYIMQQFRIQNKFQLNTQGFQSLTILLNCCLNACFKFRDSKYSRQLLVLSFTYYTVNKQEVQLPYLSFVQGNSSIEAQQHQDLQFQSSLPSTLPSTIESLQQSKISSVIEDKINYDDTHQSKLNGESNKENILIGNTQQVKEIQLEDPMKYHNENGKHEVSEAINKYGNDKNEEDEEQEEESKEKDEVQQKQNGQINGFSNDEQNLQQQQQQQQKEVTSTKIYLYQQIFNHHLWKSRDFWESAIFDSAFEELKGCSELKKGESLKESQQREKNMCFGQLVSILQNMLLFEIDKREIKFLLLKFAKLFYLSDEQLKILNATIDQHMYSNNHNKIISSINI